MNFAHTTTVSSLQFNVPWRLTREASTNGRCDVGGAMNGARVIYFPTTWGAKEPQNLPNHRDKQKQPLTSAWWL